MIKKAKMNLNSYDIIETCPFLLKEGLIAQEPVLYQLVSIQTLYHLLDTSFGRVAL